MQGMLKLPVLMAIFLYNMYQFFALFLIHCMVVSMSEETTAPTLADSFSINSLIQELEGGRYMGLILTLAMEDMIRRSMGVKLQTGYKRNISNITCSCGTGVGGGGVSDTTGGRRTRSVTCGIRTRIVWKVSRELGGLARVKLQYEVHWDYLPFRYRGNSWIFLAVMVLPIVQGHVICKNRHL